SPSTPAQHDADQRLCLAIADGICLLEFPRHRAHRRTYQPSRRHQPVENSRERPHTRDRTLRASHHVEFVLDDSRIVSICEPYARENNPPLFHHLPPPHPPLKSKASNQDRQMTIE